MESGVAGPEAMDRARFRVIPRSAFRAPCFLNMPIVVIGLSHHTSPVEMRERFAFAEARVPAQRARLAGAVM